MAPGWKIDPTTFTHLHRLERYFWAHDERCPCERVRSLADPLQNDEASVRYAHELFKALPSLRQVGMIGWRCWRRGTTQSMNGGVTIVKDLAYPGAEEARRYGMVMEVGLHMLVGKDDQAFVD